MGTESTGMKQAGEEHFLFAGGPHSSFEFRQEHDAAEQTVTAHYRGYSITFTLDELQQMRDDRHLRNVIKTWANIIDKHKRIRVCR